MGASQNVFDEHDKRLDIVTTIGIEVKALVVDEQADEITPTGNSSADRLLYARVFQAWADGKIDGEAEDIFEAVQEALDI
jgi:hypothetical protein